MKKYAFAVGLAFLLAILFNSPAFAGGCFPPEQCGVGGVVCYPVDSPENAVCELYQPGSRAGMAPETNLEDIQSCIGVEGNIPLDECRALLAETYSNPTPVPAPLPTVATVEPPCLWNSFMSFWGF